MYLKDTVGVRACLLFVFFDNEGHILKKCIPNTTETTTLNTHIQYVLYRSCPAWPWDVVGLLGTQQTLTSSFVSFWLFLHLPLRFMEQRGRLHNETTPHMQRDFKKLETYKNVHKRLYKNVPKLSS